MNSAVDSQGVLRVLDCLPDPAGSRVVALTDRHLGAHLVLPQPSLSAVLPMKRVRDQRYRPGCGGYGAAGSIDPTIPGDGLSSALSIWAGARRREGNLGDVYSGVSLSSVMAELVNRGWRLMDADEELGDDPDRIDDANDELWRHLDSLEHELEAADHKTVPAPYGVPPSSPELLRAAVDAGMGIEFGMGVLAPFLQLRGEPSKPDTFVNTNYLTGGSGLGGHAQRWAGYMRQAEQWFYLGQGSWGEEFAGCHAPDGTWLPGCFWATETVVRAAWDCWAFRIG